MAKDVLRSRLLSAQSLSADFTITPTMIKYLDNIAYQINVTTSNSIGTFVVQGSLDYNTDSTGTNAGNWIDLPLGGPNTGVPTVNAANDLIMIDMNQLPFNAIRLKYVKGTAGTGTCDIWLVGKQVGGS